MTFDQMWPVLILIVTTTLCVLIVIAVIAQVLDQVFESWFRHKATSKHILHEMHKEDHQIYGKGSHE
jgi:hypothetical protein